MIFIRFLHINCVVPGASFQPMDSKIRLRAFFNKNDALLGDRRLRPVSCPESRLLAKSGSRHLSLRLMENNYSKSIGSDWNSRLPFYDDRFYHLHFLYGHREYDLSYQVEFSVTNHCLAQ